MIELEFESREAGTIFMKPFALKRDLSNESYSPNPRRYNSLGIARVRRNVNTLTRCSFLCCQIGMMLTLAIER